MRVRAGANVWPRVFFKLNVSDHALSNPIRYRLKTSRSWRGAISEEYIEYTIQADATYQQRTPHIGEAATVRSSRQTKRPALRPPQELSHARRFKFCGSTTWRSGSTTLDCTWLSISLPYQAAKARAPRGLQVHRSY